MLSRAMAQTVAIVGAGRLGRLLGRRLHELGWPVGAVVTRSAATTRAAVRAIGAGVGHVGLTRQVLAAEVVLITTPDDAVREVAARLARMGGEEWRGKVVLHTSGALDHKALGPLARRGAATGSLHPLQTFSGRTLPRLEGIVFALEGDRRACRVARRIARELGGFPISVPAASKPAYHTAGAFAAGHVLAVVEAATRILMALGFTRRQASGALLPLVRQTLDNFEHLGPGASWTGPVSRGDYSTVAKHLAALRRFPREYSTAYAALTRLTARVLAPEKREVARRLNRVLGK